MFDQRLQSMQPVRPAADRQHTGQGTGAGVQVAQAAGDWCVRYGS